MSKQLIQVSLDGGMTFQDAPKGIRLIVKNMPSFHDDQEKNGELHVIATHNGFLLDLILNDSIGRSNLGTISVKAEYLAKRIIYEN